MLVDECGRNPWVLPIEQGGQSFSAAFTAHALAVVAGISLVPADVGAAGPATPDGRDSPVVDEIGGDAATRLAWRAGRGDRAAFEDFVRATQADVWRCCAHLVASDAADDLTQETYARLVRALPAFRGDASGRTFALAIARRVCADELRRRVRVRSLTDKLRVRRHRMAESDGAGARALGELVGQLDEERRAAFVLTQLLGLSYDEAAAVCGCAVGTIRSRVSRARRQLVDALDDTDAREGNA
jgi:RNA polymerase sigma-70 factor (ECF subfamily)